MQEVIEQLGTEEIISQLPTADLKDSELGDGVWVVYDSKFSQNAQVVKGIVLGVYDNGDHYLLEPREDSDGVGRRAFKVPAAGSGEVSRMSVYDYREIDNGYGHVPTLRDSTEVSPRQGLGDIISLLDIEVELEDDFVSEEIEREFRLHDTLFTPPEKTQSAVLCDRLFDATGGAECDYEFGIPTVEWSYYISNHNSDKFGAVVDPIGVTIEYVVDGKVSPNLGQMRKRASR